MPELFLASDALDLMMRVVAPRLHIILVFLISTHTLVDIGGHIPLLIG